MKCCENNWNHDSSEMVERYKRMLKDLREEFDEISRTNTTIDSNSSNFSDKRAMKREEDDQRAITEGVTKIETGKMPEWLIDTRNWMDDMRNNNAGDREISVAISTTLEKFSADIVNGLTYKNTPEEYLTKAAERYGINEIELYIGELKDGLSTIQRKEGESVIAFMQAREIDISRLKKLECDFDSKNLSSICRKLLVNAGLTDFAFNIIAGEVKGTQTTVADYYANQSY
jgi:hypothetical protein